MSETMQDHDIDYWMVRCYGLFGEMVKNHFDLLSMMESPIEKIAFLELIQLLPMYGMYHLTLYPQAQIKEFRVDFLLEYSDKRIVIECDGHEFHEKTKKQVSRDKKRDRDLQKLGFIVLRYSGSDIVKDPSKINGDIRDILGYPEWDKEEVVSE